MAKPGRIFALCLLVLAVHGLPADDDSTTSRASSRTAAQTDSATTKVSASAKSSSESVPVSASTSASSAAASPTGCVGESTKPTCGDGEVAVYTGATLDQCPYYECRVVGGSESKPKSKAISVALPAVFGTVFGILLLVGTWFLYRRWRSTRHVPADSQRLGSRDGMLRQGRPSETEKWGNQGMVGIRMPTDNRASVPIFYSSNDEDEKRRTQFYGSAGSPYGAKRGSTIGNVVNVVASGGKAQLKTSLRSASPRPGSSRTVSPHAAGPPSVILPSDRSSARMSGVAHISSTVNTQKPRLVQMARPKILHSPSALQPVHLNSPLRMDDRPDTGDSMLIGSMSKPVSQAGAKSARLSMGNGNVVD
ncbi:hypothetical protein DL89DRAFT_268001 [Linderina pennispora]|uniref:Uncharacterized protein n=1 Tax=Linderina pennispora TaxID=61395 RepID=A0A1Y1W6L0_9FUNG|nr:uncharacterized protein DL89DRAFT_268001 [Linderina pennispora]ORX68958.1 hypothetical protein DL89DRAFT_268001 [Linderina pennispora]